MSENENKIKFEESNLNYVASDEYISVYLRDFVPNKMKKYFIIIHNMIKWIRDVLCSFKIRVVKSKDSAFLAAVNFWINGNALRAVFVVFLPIFHHIDLNLFIEPQGL